MFKGVVYLTCTCIIFCGLCAFAAETTSANSKTETGKIIKQQTAGNSSSEAQQKVDPTAISTKVKDFFNKNEQKEKKIRSKDIVRYKEKIRKQEMLRLQKEKEIKYLERRLQEKQKTLERLEKSKGE